MVSPGTALAYTPQLQKTGLDGTAQNVPLDDRVSGAGILCFADDLDGNRLIELGDIAAVEAHGDVAESPGAIVGFEPDHLAGAAHYLAPDDISDVDASHGLLLLVAYSPFPHLRKRAKRKEHASPGIILSATLAFIPRL